MEHSNAMDKKVNKLCMSEHFWVTGTLGGISLFCTLFGCMTGKYGFLAVGVAMLIGAVITFKLGLGISTALVTPVEQSQEYVHVTKGAHYALEQELEKRLRNKAKLEDEQRETTKYFFIGVLLFLGGCALIKWKFEYLKMNLQVVFDGYTSLSYVAILLGVALVVVGVRVLWYWFVNSNFGIAVNLSDFLTLDTYPMKIRKENILIGAISHRIENDRKKARMERKAEEGLIVGLDNNGNII